MSEEGTSTTPEQLAKDILQEQTPEATPEATPEVTPEPEVKLDDAAVKDGGPEVKEGDKTEATKEDEIKAAEDKVREDMRAEEDRMGSRQFAALSRKEKALRVREKALEEKAEQYKELENLVEEAKNDPVSAMEKLGLTYEQLTTYILKGDKPEIAKLSKLEEKIKSLETGISKYEEDAVKRRTEDAVDIYKDRISEALVEGKEVYELLNANGDARDIVYEIINQDFETKKATADIDGYEISLDDALSIENAAKIAEDFLYDEIKKYQNTKKFAPKEPKTSVSKPTKIEEKVEVKPSTPNTLTNELATQSPPDKKILTRDEEIAIAAKTFKLFQEEE